MGSGIKSVGGSGGKLRILLVDDHEIVRHGLRMMLETRADWEVCGEATNGRDAVTEAVRLQPAVVIMDITMPLLNGLEATRQIKRALPQTQVLILTMHESETLVRELLTAGAIGYLLKSDTGRCLLEAVEKLGRAAPYFNSRIARMIYDTYLSRAANRPGIGTTLTPRERETVQLIAEGRSNKVIAETLGISVNTVVRHRANIMKKLRLRSVASLVRYAVRNHIIQA